MEGARTATVLPAAEHEAEPEEHEGNAARLAARPGPESSVLQHAAAGGSAFLKMKRSLCLSQGSVVLCEC